MGNAVRARRIPRNRAQRRIASASSSRVAPLRSALSPAATRSGTSNCAARPTQVRATDITGRPSTNARSASPNVNRCAQNSGRFVRVIAREARSGCALARWTSSGQAGSQSPWSRAAVVAQTKVSSAQVSMADAQRARRSFTAPAGSQQRCAMRTPSRRTMTNRMARPRCSARRLWKTRLRRTAAHPEWAVRTRVGRPIGPLGSRWPTRRDGVRAATSSSRRRSSRGTRRCPRSRPRGRARTASRRRTARRGRRPGRD